ncbi:MAG TPA: hypothetical protein DC047_18375 [Blastocatellia bacterium]|nr:hypothetical protein [Blastocatellia bacterium]
MLTQRLIKQSASLSFSKRRKLLLLLFAIVGTFPVWFGFEHAYSAVVHPATTLPPPRLVTTNVVSGKEPGAADSIVGRVVDARNIPVKGVQVRVPGRLPVLTNAKGEFMLRGLSASDRLPVSFTAPGFMNTTRIFKVGSVAGGGTTVVIWARSVPVSIDTRRGGKVRFRTGGGVTIVPNSLVDENGKPVRGIAKVSLTLLDVSDRNQLRSVPGDFTAQMSDKSIRMLESFGVFEISITDARGRRTDFAPGKPAKFDLPIPARLRRTAPKRSRLFSFNIESGRWLEEGEVVLTEQLFYSGTITRTDWDWNVDDPLDTTCITIKFQDVYGSNSGPIANALVEATGVSYSTISSGYTNSQGLVCLLVKINSAIVIKAYDPMYPTYPIGPATVTSPNVPAGAADCGDPVKCPLVITMEQDAD